MIRKAIESDAKQIALIVYSAWQTAFSGIVEETFPKSIDKNKYENIFNNYITNKNEEIYVYENEKKEVIGFILGKVNLKNMEAEITGLYILPSFQGFGVGRKLLEYLKVKWKSNKITKIELSTLKNAKNNEFYIKNKGIIKNERVSIIGGKEYQGIVFEFNLEEES